MVLYIVGLGLYDENDITLRSPSGNQLLFEDLYGREVIVADREMVESEAEIILEGADNEDVAFLVVGDPFGATTHSDMWLRAKELGIEVRVVHNASVMNAVGACGLQLYRFGESVSIVRFTDTWRPDSFYDRIAANRRLGLHTLCLLDIKVKEPNLESLARGRKVYEPPYYMTINEAVAQLLEVEAKRGEGACAPGQTAVGISRLQAPDQQIVAGTLEQLLQVDFGAPLHCLVIAGEVHHMEEEMLKYFRVKAVQCSAPTAAH